MLRKRDFLSLVEELSQMAVLVNPGHHSITPGWGFPVFKLVALLLELVSRRKSDFHLEVFLSVSADLAHLPELIIRHKVFNLLHGFVILLDLHQSLMPRQLSPDFLIRDPNKSEVQIPEKEPILEALHIAIEPCSVDHVKILNAILHP